jgi:hypothetical protein
MSSDLDTKIFENKLNLLKLKYEEFKLELKRPVCLTLRDRCDKIKNDIDIQTENLIVQLNSFRQNLFDQIDEYEKEILKYHENNTKTETFVKNHAYPLINNFLTDPSFLTDPKCEELVDLNLEKVIDASEKLRSIKFNENILKYEKNLITFNRNIMGKLQLETIEIEKKNQQNMIDFQNPSKINIFNTSLRSKVKKLQNGNFVHVQNNSKQNLSIFIWSSNFKTIKFERTFYRPNLLIYENFIDVLGDKIFIYLELFDDDEDYRTKFENYFVVLDSSLNILSEKVITVSNFELRKIASNKNFILAFSSSNKMHIFDWNLTEISSDKNFLPNLSASFESIEYFNQIKLSTNYLFISYKREYNNSNFFMRVICLKNNDNPAVGCRIVSDFEMDNNFHQFDIFNSTLLTIFKYVGPSFLFYNWINGKKEYQVQTEYNTKNNPLILIQANSDSILFYDYFKKKLYKI